MLQQGKSFYKASKVLENNMLENIYLNEDVSLFIPMLLSELMAIELYLKSNISGKRVKKTHDLYKLFMALSTEDKQEIIEKIRMTEEDFITQIKAVKDFLTDIRYVYEDPVKIETFQQYWPFVETLANALFWCE